jgi:hypothetical protein
MSVDRRIDDVIQSTVHKSAMVNFWRIQYVWISIWRSSSVNCALLFAHMQVLPPTVEVLFEQMEEVITKALLDVAVEKHHCR